MATARRHPVVSLGIALVGTLVVPFPYGNRLPVWVVFVLVAMCYQAGLRMPRARPGLLLGGAVAVLGLPLSLLVGEDGLGDWAELVTMLVFAGLSPWLLGRYVRLRGELARTGWRRAEEMESRQRLVADQARLRERARIASDMHDSLGHELSLIAVRAAALEVAAWPRRRPARRGRPAAHQRRGRHRAAARDHRRPARGRRTRRAGAG